ncbi:hypothetical protein ACP70R_019160 [Stipagrostis hirtigluma subsp. patula]
MNRIKHGALRFFTAVTAAAVAAVKKKKKKRKGHFTAAASSDDDDDEDAPPPIVLAMDLHCAACAGKIRDAVMDVPGVKRATVNVGKNLVAVTGTADAAVVAMSVQVRTRRPVTVVGDGRRPGVVAGTTKQSVKVRPVSERAAAAAAQEPSDEEEEEEEEDVAERQPNPAQERVGALAMRTLDIVDLDK